MATCYSPYQTNCSDLNTSFSVVTIVPNSQLVVSFYLVEVDATTDVFVLEFYSNFKVSNGVLIETLTPDSIDYGEFLLPNSELKLATKVTFTRSPSIDFGNLPYREATEESLIPGSNCGVYHLLRTPIGGETQLLVFGFAVLMKV